MLPASRLAATVQCNASAEPGTAISRAGNAVATTTRLSALFRITACSATNPNSAISSGSRNSAPPSPIMPPSTPTAAHATNASGGDIRTTGPTAARCASTDRTLRAAVIRTVPPALRPEITSGGGATRPWTPGDSGMPRHRTRTRRAHHTGSQTAPGAARQGEACATGNHAKWLQPASQRSHLERVATRVSFEEHTDLVPVRRVLAIARARLKPLDRWGVPFRP
jgi:hypothetical protein